MAFKLPPENELTQPVPEQFRDTYLQALTELEERKRFLIQAAEELELAAALRAGQMDSQSRADDVARQVRQTLITLAARARQLA